MSVSREPIRNNIGGTITPGMGLSKVPDGHLPKQHSIRDLFGNRVVEINRPVRDKTLNDDIEERGAHFGGSAKPWPGNDGIEPFFNAKEYLWHKTHK